MERNSTPSAEIQAYIDIARLQKDVGYIRSSVDDMKKSWQEQNDKLSQKIIGLETYQQREKIYVGVAVALGAVVVWLVDKAISFYAHLK